MRIFSKGSRAIVLSLRVLCLFAANDKGSRECTDPIYSRHLRANSTLRTPHLGREFADVVFVEQVAERADGHFEDIGGSCLAAAALF